MPCRLSGSLKRGAVAYLLKMDENKEELTMNKTRLSRALIATAFAVALSACGAKSAEIASAQEGSQVTEVTQAVVVSDQALAESSDTTSAQSEQTQSDASSSSTSATMTSIASMTSDGIVDTTDFFSDRDLTQEADLSGASNITVENDREITITEEGTYVLSGEATNATIVVNADETAKVQLVLDGLTVTNDDYPVIYVVSADKTFVTTASGSQNTLSVTGTFRADGETSTDAAIFSKDDLVLNGLGTLTISSTDNGITSKDDLKITGGTYNITCTSDALEANEDIRIAGGDFTITTDKDGMHAGNDDDTTSGAIYICGGTFKIDAQGDGIQGNAVVQIDDGTFELSAAEAIESTYIQMNGGDVSISSWDDGINASYKSTAYTPTIDIRGGNLSITMAQGDTDAIDSNGYIYVSGGTIDISAQFAFDYDMGAEHTGGTIYVNGEEVSEITESMMMGGGMGGRGMGGEMGGPGF